LLNSIDLKGISLLQLEQLMAFLLDNFIFILAYLLGSIPTAVWVSKYFFKIDIREHGSGNAGTTNTLRILGNAPAVGVMLVDVLKGLLAAQLAYLSTNFFPHTDAFVNFQALLGIAAVVGHIFPIFAGFRGGKGIATLFGVLLGIHTTAAVMCMAVFFITLLLSHYVSLSSMIASISLPLIIFIAFKHDDQVLLRLFAIGGTFLVVATHQKNIQRLLKGEESKTFLFKKRK
jgi:glycerol-3-phosphate acyltransferase PlsY